MGRLRHWLHSNRRSPTRRLADGLLAYGAGDAVTRVIRLLTVLVIARALVPELIGQAAIALTMFELIRVLARNGIGQAIIACPPDRLAATCNRAHTLFWRWAWLLVVTQLVVALLMAQLFDQPLAAAMLAVLSLVYPLMPGGLVQVHLAMREGLVARTARTNAIQTGADHVLTAMLLIAWPSPWSLVLPKLLTAPVWLVLARRARPWRADPAVAPRPIDGLVPMGAGVMGTEALAALRSNADNLVLAAMLGTSALGTYYFAFSAGLGIATSLITAMGNTLFPLLCAAGDDDRRAVMRRVIPIAVVAGAAPILLQAAAAPFYVPVIFGERWAFAASLVSILCLAGLAQLVQVLIGSWLRSTGRAPLEALCSLLACAGALTGLTIGAASGSLWAAAVGLTTGQMLAAAISLALFVPTRHSPFRLRGAA